MHPFLTIAVKAARLAGKSILQKSYRVDQLRLDTKGVRDYVSEVDLLAEQQIVEVIQEAYPDHAIIAEEKYSKSGERFEWIVDPLDGTTNFIHGVQQYCVSIAARRGPNLEIGVVYDPVHEEMFTAARGSGAMLNDRRIRVSGTRDLPDALIGTGFPFRDNDNLDMWMAVFQKLAKRTSGIRRPGSAALDLAYVACGRFDGFWESGLQLWDMAAGAILVQESGGMVCDFQGNQDFLKSGMIVAGNPSIHDEMIKIVRHETQKFHSDG